MSYFSRLTDIVTCNLSDILARETDQLKAIDMIIGEMEEGLGGARRSVETAESSVGRIEREIDEQTAQIEYWISKAKKELSAGNEELARQALLRKQEVEDITAGLHLQLQAAIATRDHLTTTRRALEARLAEAHRKRSRLQTGANVEGPAKQTVSGKEVQTAAFREAERSKKVEEELDALKQELGKSK